MNLTIEYPVEIVENDSFAEAILDVEVHFSRGTNPYFSSSFGNYLPGEPDDVKIEALYLDGEPITIEKAIELTGEKNLVETLEREAFEQAAAA